MTQVHQVHHYCNSKPVPINGKCTTLTNTVTIDWIQGVNAGLNDKGSHIKASKLINGH